MRIIGCCLVISAFLLTGCGTTSFGIDKYTGFYPLPFPNNNYAPGQVIELWNDRPRVDIAHIPDLGSTKALESPGWSLSFDDSNKIRAAIAADVEPLLTASAGYNSGKRVVVSLSNTKTRLLPMDTIYSTLKRSINASPDTKEMIERYRGYVDSRYFVLTQVLIADIQLSVVGSDNKAAKLDADLTARLKARFGADLEIAGNSDVAIVGKQLVVAIHFDEEMIRYLLPSKCSSLFCRLRS